MALPARFFLLFFYSYNTVRRRANTTRNSTRVPVTVYNGVRVRLTGTRRGRREFAVSVVCGNEERKQTEVIGKRRTVRESRSVRDNTTRRACRAKTVYDNCIYRATTTVQLDMRACVRVYRGMRAGVAHYDDDDLRVVRRARAHSRTHFLNFFFRLSALNVSEHGLRTDTLNEKSFAHTCVITRTKKR